ncbi:porin family protein [Daeguia caeni]|uniref:Porin family protein n=1 Tax=Daeguia caeni TaxID=439612 RepID=A0ABV9H791_9HYPH
MKLKTSFLASCMIAAGIVGANAADAVIAEEPVPVVSAPVFTWAGPYIGGQVGYGWGRSKFSNDEDTLKMKPDGFLGGIYAGYNLDVGDNFILGIDGDVTYNDLDKGISHYDPEDDDAMEISTRLRWSGAVRARAGVRARLKIPFLRYASSFA